MSVESATYIGDLQAANPPDTDPRAQGAQHIRLIKQVLQNTFPFAERAVQIPGTRAISASYPVLKVDGECTIYCNTASGAVTFTLPTLASGDAGWKTHFVKTSSDANPMFIAPPSGTLNSGGLASLSKARRCIPGVRVVAIWDGTSWFVTRATAVPIGSLIDYAGAALPAGYEWPSGQTLSSAANYPEYNATVGSLVTPDMRGRIGITLDNLGGTAAGRLGTFIAGGTLGASGGTEGVTLAIANLPAHQHAVYLKDPNHTHNFVQNSVATATVYTNVTPQYIYQAGGTQGAQEYATTIQASATGVTIGSVSGVANDNQTATVGSGTAYSNLQPSIMLSKLLVVE